jgi:hypothetical protein
MVLVQAEEQRPLRREAMKPGELGDIQTLGENASTWEQTVHHHYILGGRRRLSLLAKNNDSTSKKGLYQMYKVDSWATTCVNWEWKAGETHNDWFTTNHREARPSLTFDIARFASANIR